MKYDLQDIATVSGMPGLFKVLKPTRTGVVLESLDEVKKRVMAQTRHKISILKEISIFTTGADSIALEEVFKNIYAKHQDSLSIDHKKASKDDLKAFLSEIVKDFDEERVYPSDIKKLIQWYKIVAKQLKPVKEEEEKKETKKDSKKEGEKKEKKPAAKAKKEPAAKKEGAKKKAPAKKKATTKK